MGLVAICMAAVSHWCMNGCAWGQCKVLWGTVKVLKSTKSVDYFTASNSRRSSARDTFHSNPENLPDWVPQLQAIKAKDSTIDLNRSLTIVWVFLFDSPSHFFLRHLQVRRSNLCLFFLLSFFFFTCRGPTVTYPQDLITGNEKTANYLCACVNELITSMLCLPLFSLDVS